jgi:hypothetical protein
LTAPPCPIRSAKTTNNQTNIHTTVATKQKYQQENNMESLGAGPIAQPLLSQQQQQQNLNGHHHLIQRCYRDHNQAFVWSHVHLNSNTSHDDDTEEEQHDDYHNHTNPNYNENHLSNRNNQWTTCAIPPPTIGRSVGRGWIQTVRVWWVWRQDGTDG